MQYKFKRKQLVIKKRSGIDICGMEKKTTGLTIKFNMQKHLQISRFYSLRLAVNKVTTI